MPLLSSSTHANETRSLVARQATLSYQMPDDLAAEYKAATIHAFRQVYEGVVSEHRELSFEHWVSRFPANRAKQLRRAKALLDREGLLPQDFVIDAFVKKEKVNKSLEWSFEDYDPRCISSFRDKYVAATGPWLHGIQKALGRVLNSNSDSGLFYTSGHGAAVVGNWLSESLHRLGRLRMEREGLAVPCAYAWTEDFSRLDGNLSPEIMAPAETLYDRLGGDSVARKAVATTHESSYSKMKHGARMSRPAGMQSGRADTNARDVLECFQINWFCYYSSQPEPGLTLEDRELALCGTGDDGNGISCNPVVQSAFEEEAKKLGMPLTIDMFDMEYDNGYWTNIHRLEYCSSLYWPVLRPAMPFEQELDVHPPAWDTHGWVLGPKPGRILARLGWDITGTLNPAGHMRGVCLGLQDDVWHVPFAHEFVQRMLALTEGARVVESRPDGGIKHHVDRRYERHPEHTWRLVYERYGLTKDDLREFVMQLRQVKRLPAAIGSRVVERLINVDLERE